MLIRLFLRMRTIENICMFILYSFEINVVNFVHVALKIIWLLSGP